MNDLPQTEPPSRQRPPARPALLVGVLFITALCVFSATFAVVKHLQGQSFEGVHPVAERKPADLTMTTLDGATFSVADHAGQVLLINFFATWCPPCRDELPDLVQIATEYAPADKGNLVTAAVSLDSDSDRIALLQRFSKENHFPFPTLLPAAASPLLTDTPPIPQTLLIDRHGRIARLIVGRFDPADVRASLKALFDEH